MFSLLWYFVYPAALALLGGWFGGKVAANHLYKRLTAPPKLPDNNERFTPVEFREYPAELGTNKGCVHTYPRFPQPQPGGPVQGPGHVCQVSDCRTWPTCVGNRPAGVGL